MQILCLNFNNGPKFWHRFSHMLNNWVCCNCHQLEKHTIIWFSNPYVVHMCNTCVSKILNTQARPLSPSYRTSPPAPATIPILFFQDCHLRTQAIDGLAFAPNRRCWDSLWQMSAGVGWLFGICSLRVLPWVESGIASTGWTADEWVWELNTDERD